MFVGAQSLERWWGSGSDGVWFEKLGGCLFTDCRLERGLEKARKRPAAAENAVPEEGVAVEERGRDFSGREQPRGHFYFLCEHTGSRGSLLLSVEEGV